MTIARRATVQLAVFAFGSDDDSRICLHPVCACVRAGGQSAVGARAASPSPGGAKFSVLKGNPAKKGALTCASNFPPTTTSRRIGTA